MEERLAVSFSWAAQRRRGPVAVFSYELRRWGQWLMKQTVQTYSGRDQCSGPQGRGTQRQSPTAGGHLAVLRTPREIEDMIVKTLK